MHATGSFKMLQRLGLKDPEDSKVSGGKKFTGAILLVMPIEVELRCLLFLSLLGVIHHG